MSLENAPKHIKLAVDLIQLLEENQLPTKTVLDALAIVQQDFQRKVETQTVNSNK
ncbi:pleiotropic regulatory protein RsmS [Moritella sp. 24]|uniref:pleiotropic regulatory protein RsmS n=1 Tax=Moritella sp. 24 TaxID=2746230 RepID=UPI001BA82002|nr:pleiotropic regulatory protein RsmS [Moritella sp. 24]QUM76005.1 pleiotropic regulatory protein RsmS [Moritella sp. 24]